MSAQIAQTLTTRTPLATYFGWSAKPVETEMLLSA